MNLFLGNRFVGEIRVVSGERVFVCRRSESAHLFRLWSGLGFNARVIVRLLQEKEEFPIWVYFKRNNDETQLLKTTALRVLLHGVEWDNSMDIRDRQLILPLEKFEVC